MQKASQKTSVKLISLGCAKNLVDSEVMLGGLARNQFEIRKSEENADIGIVNTCGFIDASKEESINTILELAKAKKTGKLKYLVVAGCLSQRYIEKLPKLLPEVDAFLGSGDFQNLPHVLEEKLKGKRQKNFVHAPNETLRYDLPRLHSTPFYTRYLKISEGCSHRCSFCTIPIMRGGTVRSRPIDDIFHEISRGVQEGVKEFNFIAQDLNEYGRDLGQRTSLYALLDKLSRINGEVWMRLLYMYPLQFPDKLIALIKNHPHVCKYVDIPLQHIDDRILKSMNRGSSSHYIYRLLENLRKAMPAMALRTTFIVGYPGETEKEFEKLLSFVKEMRFDRLGAFTYSHEEDTPSFSIKKQIPQKIKEERRDILMKAQQQISLENNRKKIGSSLKVLFEGDEYQADVFDPQNYFGVGRHEGQAPEIDGEIIIDQKGPENPPAPGEFIDVKITGSLDYDLIGECL